MANICIKGTHGSHLSVKTSDTSGDARTANKVITGEIIMNDILTYFTKKSVSVEYHFALHRKLDRQLVS